MILTAEGKQNEMAMPLRPRNRMIWVLLRERPHPKMKPACKTQPVKYMKRAPSASAIAPEIRRLQPFVNAWMELGQSRRPAGMSSSFAMVGSATVVRPLRRVLIAVMPVTDAMMMAVLLAEVTVVVR